MKSPRRHAQLRALVRALFAAVSDADLRRMSQRAARALWLLNLGYHRPADVRFSPPAQPKPKSPHV